jgi:NAD(P)H dehydrogenase (quinone)
MPKVNIIFHSVSGGTFRLAEEIGAGVEEIPTCKANLLRIPEPGGAEPVTMPGLRKINHQFSHVPEATVQDLADCDGLAIGAPNYWGSMSYATKHYLDSAATLWDLGSPDRPVQSAPNFAGKPVTAFSGGGSGLVSDPPILGLWTAFGCFGMTIVTIGIAAPGVSDPARVDGGSPLGAQVFSRRPGLHPSDAECAIARAQGRALGEHTKAWAERSN